MHSTRMSTPLSTALLLFVLIFVCPGCTPPSYRVHPDFESTAKSLRTPQVILADVRIYDRSPEGRPELRDDWCAAGRQNLLHAFLNGFKQRHYTARPLAVEPGMAREMEDIQALYDAVNKSIQLHAYGPQLFPEKQKHFDYSIGSLRGILPGRETDSVVFVSAFEQVGPQDPKAYISMAVADSSGTILWYSIKGSLGDDDLRDPQRAAELVEEILSDFPAADG
jgi:hypothetical protein